MVADFRAASNAGASTTVACPTCVAGDAIYLYYSSSSGDCVTPTGLGLTWTAVDAGTFSWSGYTTANGTAQAGGNITLSPDASLSQVISIQGWDGVTPLKNLNSGTSTTATGTSTTVAAASGACLVFVVGGSSLTTPAPTGMTSRVANSDHEIWTQNSITSPNTGSRTRGCANDDWGTEMIVFEPSAPPGPTINSGPQSQTKFIGSTATFTVSATGTGTLHYQWKRNGGNVGTDSSNYTTPTLDFSNNGDVYTVDVTDDNGTVTSDLAFLTVIFSTSIAWFVA